MRPGSALLMSVRDVSTLKPEPPALTAPFSRRGDEPDRLTCCVSINAVGDEATIIMYPMTGPVLFPKMRCLLGSLRQSGNYRLPRNGLLLATATSSSEHQMCGRQLMRRSSTPRPRCSYLLIFD
jgi:hypothetical protein